MAYTTSHILGLTRAAFRQEADELLAELDTALMRLETTPKDSAMLNRAFRAIHTMKGSGATAGFSDISKLLHHAEDMFNDAREGRTCIDTSVVDLVLKLTDIVRKMLQADQTEGGQLLEEGLRLVASLHQVQVSLAPPPMPKFLVVEPSPGKAGGVVYSVYFEPEQRVFFSGNDPLVMLQELLQLGHGVVRANVAQLPSFSDMDPELCYLSWETHLASAEPEAALRDVFLFVQDESKIEIDKVASEHAMVLPNGAYYEPGMLKDFLEESEEDVAEIESEVLALEETPGEKLRIEALCRTLHNLKGLAHLLLSDVKRRVPPDHPMWGVAELCHAVESFLEPYRGPDANGLGSEAIQTLLSSTDWLKTLLTDLAASRACAWPAILRESLPSAAVHVRAPAASASPKSVRPEHSDRVLLSVARQCREVLVCTILPADGDAKLGAEDMKTMSRALHTLRKAATFGGQAILREKADLLMSLCDTGSVDLGFQSESDMKALVQGYESLALTIGDLERTASPSIRAKAKTISIRPSGRPSGRPSVRPSGRASARAIAPRGAEAAATPGSASSRSIRVDQAKLDRLMRVVGELLVAKNALPILASRAGEVEPTIGKDVKELGSRISHIADELQDVVKDIRMMPIKTVFQRFPRLIRDMAQAAGKQVQLVIQGEDNELDKTVLEQIADPLVHLVRNAVDHGIEPTADRRTAGKADMGTVGLEVIKQGNLVIIRICDDGRGMSPEKLRKKAVEKGLVSASEAQAMSDPQVLELIFLPGFSTAEKVTDVSGRGVGMDVVRSNVESLHGTVSIESELGKGTTFSIALPTSLMVSKGILVETAGELYVLPIESTREMVMVGREQVHRFRGHSFTNIRGSVCPLASLAQVLNLPGARDVEAMNKEQFHAAVIRTSQGDAVVLVDRLVAEIDVIVKPLVGGLGKIPIFQGASILGDGRVVLVLDAARLDLGFQANSAGPEAGLAS